LAVVVMAAIVAASRFRMIPVSPTVTPPSPVLAAAFRPATGQTLEPGLVAQVFGDMYFRSLVKTRIDRKIDIEWPPGVKPAAGITNRRYGVRWTGVVVVPAGGASIGFKADDGVRLSLDGRTIIEFRRPSTLF